MSSKLFLGHRLRRLRRDHDLSQTDMAQTLAISPSYLNHLERNQRPVTAALLLKLAELYEVDVRSFAANGGAKTGPDALGEIFSDALLSDLGVPRYELAELANNAPSIADAIARLYSALKEAGRNPSMASAGDARALVTPENWVRDYIQQHRNYYPALEEAAQNLGASRARAFVKVTLPLMGRGVLAGGLLAFVSSSVDLSSTMLLVPRVELGPLSYGIYLYMQSAVGRGPGAALGVVAIALVATGTWLATRLARRGERGLFGV